MPVVDMPLEQLREYKGISPCPADFAEYWERALEEMRGVDPQIELIPSDFSSNHADCFDLYFTGVRGARLHAKYIRPKAHKEKCPAVLMFHGYSGNCGGWLDKLAFAAEGFCVAALDCRGQGGLSEDVGGVKGTTFHGHIVRGMDDAPDNMLMRHIFLDTAQLAKIVMEFDEVDENRVAAMGASQGGGLTLACASLEPKIKKVVAGCPFLCDYQRVWDMGLGVNAYAEIRDYFRIYDPLHEREKEIFERYGYIDVKNLTDRIRGEVMVVTGLEDTVCPPSSQFAAYNHIISEKKMLVLPDFGHDISQVLTDPAFQFIKEIEDLK